jgi:hypothetical protein
MRAAPAIAVVAMLATAVPAHADGESQQLEIDNCPVAPDLDQATQRSVASDHYDRGGVLYFQGDYEGAIREFVAALCLLPSAPEVLYTIGQSYERLLQFERAIAYYRRYAATLDEKHATDKQNVTSRIVVLENLPAQVQVATTPPGATVSFTDAGGLRRDFGRPGDKPFEVRAGTYTMRIELAGYQTVEQTITTRIGKPYSYYFALVPRRGRLVVNADPVDARIFVDDRLVGIGRYDDEVAGGTYHISVEATNRTTVSRQVQVVADRDTETSVRLESKPTSGRTQLLIASSVGGFVLGGIAFGVLDKNISSGALGGLGGLGLGFGGAYFGIPRDLEVGSSSYIITSGLIGAGEAGFTASIVSNGQTTVGDVAVGGMAVGAAVGILSADRFHLDAGDAALLNTGALWGTIGGGLFAAIFEFKDKVSQGLALGGLNLGVVTGALLGRRMTVSRGHVALIDLAGFAGMGIAVATQSAIDNARGVSSTDQADNTERTAHFALAGMAIGLTAGAWFTRNMDAPKLPHVAPAMSTAKDAGGKTTAIFGFGGSL